MEIKPTSTTRTHRGKRLVRSLTLTGALIVVASLTMLNATASRTSASNVTVTADGTQMALMTEPPQDGTSVQREAWRESVLADPNVLGDNAPGTVAQSSDSRHIFLRAKDSDDPGSVTDTASASPTATSQEEGRDRPLSDKEKEAIAAAEKVVKPIAEQVAPVYATYSVSSGQAAWVDSVSTAVTKSGALMGADLKTSLESGASETWPAVQSAHVTSTARVYPGRAPAVGVPGPVGSPSGGSGTADGQHGRRPQTRRLSHGDYQPHTQRGRFLLAGGLPVLPLKTSTALRGGMCCPRQEGGATVPARTAPAPKRQMSRPTLLAARALNWVHRLWNTVSTILAAMAWMVSLIPAWVPLCAYPNMQDVGMIAGISTGLLTSVAAVYFPTRTPAWRTIAWAWLASILCGAVTLLATLHGMTEYAPWPTLAAVGAAFLVVAARTHSTARTLVGLARDLWWMR